MTPEQIVLVEQTLTAVDQDLNEVARNFYRRLFIADPACAEMFTEDWDLQRAKFSAELEEIIFSIRQHAVFVERAEELGARHLRYGVRPTHYRLVGVALLAAIQEALGERWTPEVDEAWRLAYNLTAEAMMAGAARALPTS